MTYTKMFRTAAVVCWIVLFAGIHLLGQTGAARPATLGLMPVPTYLQPGNGRLAVVSGFGVSVEGYTDERLNRAIDRALLRLNRRTGLSIARSAGAARAGLVIRVDASGEKIQSPAEDETYSLEITSERAQMHAHTVVGAMRGIETLLQLLDADAQRFFFPAVHIEDRPRFAWRGLLLDVSRHWEPVEVVKRTLDAMAAVKLNVFHWHLSDDQGFRIESRVLPRLHQFGSDGCYYTQAQVREVIAYARDRGIRVIPEFDMPGHAHAWFIGYPQLASAPGPYSFKHYLGGDSVPFDPTRKQTYRFLDKFIGEMAGLFPDAYWHVGGDEVDGTPWDKNPAIQAFMKAHGIKDNAALQVYFNQQLGRIMRRHGKQMVGWDEIIHPDLPKDAVIQSWRGSDSLAAAARAGYRGILSAPYYLDKMFPTSSYYAGDPLPLESDLNAAEEQRILGGEVCVWGELVSEENIDSRIWPYTAAVAERLWSPQAVNDVADMYRRLDIVSVYLEEAGARHLSNTEALLRNAAGGDVPATVRDFVGLLEPLQLGMRQQQRRPDQLTLLTALGDIVVADPPAARRFALQVRAFLGAQSADTALRDQLMLQLKEWQAFRAEIVTLAARAPLFHDAEGSASDLTDLGVAGEEAIEFISSGTTPPADWREKQNSLLDRAAEPKGLLRLAVLDALRELLAVAENRASAAWKPSSL